MNSPSTSIPYDARTAALLARLGTDLTEQDYADLAVACADRAGLSVTAQIDLTVAFNARRVKLTESGRILRLVPDPGDTDRRYVEHRDEPGVCKQCGNLPDRHRDQLCPHTVDSLTTDQIGAWVTDGGQADVALDASPELRRRLRAMEIIGVRTPSRDAEDAARRVIVDAMNSR